MAAAARGEQIEVSRQRPARGAHRHQSADERVGSERHEPADAARSSSRPARSACPPRSSSAPTRRWTICSRRSSRRSPTRRSAAASRASRTLPHLREFAVIGPSRVTGVSETPSRRRVFTCRPLSAAEEVGCATRIITSLATKAYRRPVTAQDVDGLLTFYTTERARGRLRVRHPHRAPGDAREPAFHLPPRGSARERACRAGLRAQRRSTWRRGSRSSSGAAARTTS